MGPGDQVDRYRLEAQTASGWRARHVDNNEVVRLRFVDPFEDDGAFVSAARALCGVLSPNLQTLLDVGVDAQGQSWVVDPWQAGETLSDRVARAGALSVDELLAVAETLLAGVAAAHTRGIHDGAITPERVRIVGEPPEGAVLVNPGLAGLITDLIPDPDYDPPEGSAPSLQADLFGVAATLCFAINGRSVPSGEVLAVAIPKLPAPLADALRQCLDPSPEDRPHSAEPLRRTVEALRAGTLDWEVPGSTVAVDAAPTIDQTATDGEAETELPGWMSDERPRLPGDPEFAYLDEVGGLPGVAPTPDQAAPAPIMATRPDAPPVPARAPAKPAPAKPAPAKPAATASPQPPTPPVPPPSNRILYIGTGAVLIIGISLVTIWWGLREPPPELVVPPAPDTAPASIAAPATAAPSSLALTSGTEKIVVDRTRFEQVRVVVSPGPARFVQTPTNHVLCDEVSACMVPIDVEVRVEKTGYRSRVLSGDDLYDRRGGRWRIKLFPGRAAKGKRGR